MSAWGKTGRVTLGKKRTPSLDVERDVKIDGKEVGSILYPREPSFPGFGAISYLEYEEVPSRDAAILWVLRRVDPALWRQERGEVFRVQVGTTEFPLARWHIHHPTAGPGRRYGCTSEHFDSTPSWESALDAALKYAEKKAATR